MRHADQRSRASVLALVLGAGLTIAAACGPQPEPADQATAPRVVEAWARAVQLPVAQPPGNDDPPRPRRSTGAYITLENPGPRADRLLAVEGDVADAIEIHRTQVEDGVMRMRQVEGGLELPPGETVEMRPGGLHIMLIGMRRSLEPGDRLTLTLRFQQAGAREVDVEIRAR